MRDAQRARNRAAYRAPHGPSVGHRDQVDVLAEATGWQVCAGKSGSAEEDQLVGMSLKRSEDRRDQVVAMDLFKRDTKLVRDACCFVPSQSARVRHRVKSRARASAERSR